MFTTRIFLCSTFLQDTIRHPTDGYGVSYGKWLFVLSASQLAASDGSTRFVLRFYYYFFFFCVHTEYVLCPSWLPLYGRCWASDHDSYESYNTRFLALRYVKAVDYVLGYSRDWGLGIGDWALGSRSVRSDTLRLRNSGYHYNNSIRHALLLESRC